MINLIPPDARSRIITEYWVRVVTVWCFLVTIAALVVGSLMLPAYVLVTSQVRVYEEAAREASTRVAEHDSTNKTLVNASVRARMILEADKQPSLMEVYETLDSIAATQAIAIKGYELRRSGTALGAVRIDGVADTRVALASFRDQLTAHPTITSVNLPISNLAKDRDLPFSLDIVMASSTTPTP